MTNDSADKLLKRQNRHHIFSVLRRQVRKFVIPLWMLFSLVDWLYRPDLITTWLALRLFVVACWWSALPLLKIKTLQKKRLDWLAIALSCLAANSLNVMVAQSGGSQSAYISGVILTVVTCIMLFRLSWRQALCLGFLSYGPTIAVIWTFASLEDWRLPMVQSALLVSMMVLSIIFRSTESLAQSLFASAKVNVDKELRQSRRTEFLKKHFPSEIRKEIESGKLDLGKKRILPSAVVGFADISSSTEIGNSVDLMTDWEMKEKFLSLATKRATDNGLIVLTHTGDGFLFLANYFDKFEWTYSLVSFYEGLQHDFEKLRQSMDKLATSRVDTGIKCSVAMGPVVLGFIGSDQAYFTIMGPTVNLAARLCGKAGTNEIVVSSRIWDVLKHVMVGWESHETKYPKLKGFDFPITAQHIKPRTSVKKGRACQVCNASLTVIRTEEGFIDILCPNGHNKSPQESGSLAA